MEDTHFFLGEENRINFKSGLGEGGMGAEGSGAGNEKRWKERMLAEMAGIGGVYGWYGNLLQRKLLECVNVILMRDREESQLSNSCYQERLPVAELICIQLSFWPRESYGNPPKAHAAVKTNGCSL